MLPAAGTSGEAGALITAAALTTTCHFIKCPSHRLRYCSTKPSCGSSIWQAARRARAETSASQHAEPIVRLKRLETPFVEYCGSEDWRSPLQRCEGMEKVSVALGKFDAMHIGHRWGPSATASTTWIRYHFRLTGLHLLPSHHCPICRVVQKHLQVYIAAI